MNFDDTTSEAEFRAEARAWLERHASRKKSPSDRIGFDVPEPERIALAKDWQAKKAEAGYAAITLPVELGGRGGTPIQDVIWRQEEAAFRVPFGIYEITLGMCIPTVATWGSEAQKQRWIAPGLHGDDVWCQLFSEPAAGSDVAGIRMRARRAGAEPDAGWIVDGQKVWTTAAQFADWGLLLARTDPDKPKHRGLSMFVVDMRSAGVEIRPLRQMTGDAEFNEVFFDAVEIPDSCRLGPVDAGWKVALSTLMHERLSVGGGIGLIDFHDAFALASRPVPGGEPAIGDARIRDRLASWYLETQGARLLTYRGLTALSKGEMPGPEQSIVKMVTANQAQQIANVALDLLDQAGALGADALGEEWRQIEHAWMVSAAMRVAGGTDEILKNIIAERVLGLPGDVRLDKDRPFRDL